MTSEATTTRETPGELSSRAYRITVDDGRDSFFALCIEERDSDEAWLISDEVCAMENMR